MATSITKARIVIITTRPTHWVTEVEDDWDALTEDERQEQIAECAHDNEKWPVFEWNNPAETSLSPRR